MTWRFALFGVGVALCGCGPAAAPPAKDPPPAAEFVPAKPSPAADPTPPSQPDTASPERVSLLPAINSPAPKKEPPLTEEELALLAADPSTLSVEDRRKRGYALRRKILQNPDSPSARQLEALRLATERGEIDPQLPDSSKKGPVLHARNPQPAPTP